MKKIDKRYFRESHNWSTVTDISIVYFAIQSDARLWFLWNEKKWSLI